MQQTVQQYVQLAAVAVVVVGCYWVLAPFVSALLFAAVACSSSWPLYRRVRALLGGRGTSAAALVTLLLMVLVIGPTAVLAASLADNVTAGVEAVREVLERGPLMPPAWLEHIPVVGAAIANYWREVVGDREALVGLLKTLIEPGRTILVGAGKAIGASLLQFVVAAFIAFFFYRDGDRLVRALRQLLRKLAGGLGDELLATIDNTVTGVVNGLFGTALVQALVAMVGFVMAGVPGVVLLGAATFFLSLIPAGPPLVWGGAAIWLFYQGSIGWAIFIVIWGLLVISSIDNFVKPYLISRSSSLPILLIVLGVFGGIVGFGFIGVFIGPPMLAVGLTLVQLWIGQPEPPRR